MNKRERVFNKFGGRCAYCGITLDLDYFTIDHINPISKSKDNSQKNLNPACKKCNTNKASLSLEKFRYRYSIKKFLFEIPENERPKRELFQLGRRCKKRKKLKKKKSTKVHLLLIREIRRSFVKNDIPQGKPRLWPREPDFDYNG